MVPIVPLRFANSDGKLDHLGMRDRNVTPNPPPDVRIIADPRTEFGGRRRI